MGSRDNIDAIANFFLAPSSQHEPSSLVRHSPDELGKLRRPIYPKITDSLVPSPPCTSNSPAPVDVINGKVQVPWAVKSDSELTIHTYIPQYYIPLPLVNVQVPTLHLIAHDQPARLDSKIILFYPDPRNSLVLHNLVRVCWMAPCLSTACASLRCTPNLHKLLGNIWAKTCLEVRHWSSVLLGQAASGHKLILTALGCYRMDRY